MVSVEPNNGKQHGGRGNRNAMRHGLKGGKLPKDVQYIEVQMNGFRRALEDAVIGARGQITLPMAGLIQTAMRWERHAALAQRWLNKGYDKLKPEQRLHFSREIARASAERDKAISALKIDRDEQDEIIERLYAVPRIMGDNNGE